MYSIALAGREEVLESEDFIFEGGRSDYETKK